MPGEISRSYGGPRDPGAPPQWVSDLAETILAQWPRWDAEAGQCAQVEQDSDAYDFAMIHRLEAAILGAWFHR